MGKKTGAAFFTVPNLLSLFRLGLIGVFVQVYSVGERPLLGCGVLILSGLTDILDGYIARRFDMVSDVGKILDPAADKLTQAVTLICLARRFPMMLLPLGIMLVKELVSGLLFFMAIKSSGEIQSSRWHGKLNTVLLYAMLMLHLLWSGIPPLISALSIGLSIGMMLFSAGLYALGNLNVLNRRGNMP